MISIISPAKTLDFTSQAPSNKHSNLPSSTKTKKILQELKSLSVSQIKNLMKVSDKIAELNFERFQGFQTSKEKQAIFAYAGDVYSNIGTETLSNDMLKFSQTHLRIISGFYGLIRPLDNIKAYRLEMSVKLTPLAPKGLFLYWKQEITDSLNEALSNHASKHLINIASNEYSAAIDAKQLNFPMINIHFREIRDGITRNIALNSKRARGTMTGYILSNGIDDPESIKSFCRAGYKFDASLSDETNFFFIKD